MKKSILLLTSIAVATMISFTPVSAGYYHHNNMGGYYNTITDSNAQSLIDSRKVYLDSLVNSGYITREQADLELAQYKAMLEYQVANAPKAIQQKDVSALIQAQSTYLSSLVKAGYMTQAEADLELASYKVRIENSVNPQLSQRTINTSELLEARKTYLNSLVKLGYMTQQQADLEISNYKLMLESNINGYNNNYNYGYRGYGHMGGCYGGVFY